MRENWIEIELGEISQIYNGNSINEKVKEEKYQVCKIGLNYIGTKDIGFDGVIVYENGVKIPYEEPKFKIAPKNCVLVCSEGGSAGKKTAYTKEDICFGNKLYAIVNKFFVFEGKYVYYYTRYQKFFKSFQNQMNGIIGGVSVKKFSNITIPLAPLLEQKAIVAKIEQLFSELDNGISNLKTAQAKLKIYRQAVLKKAFEGELTKEWREKQTNLPTADELLEQIKKEREVHYKQQLEEWKQAVKDWEENGKDGKRPSRISKPKILDEVTTEEIDTYSELPISWKWERFNNVTHKIGDIDHKMPKPSENGIPYLSTGNIYADGTMDFQNAKTISEEDYKRLALKIKPEKNDIIFPRYGTIGRNILVNIDKKFLVSYSCAIIKNINKYINAKYAHYYSLSPVIKKEIKRYTVQTTQANIGIASIENFVFPLCSFEEQNQIVQEIESRLSVCDKIEETIETSLVKSEALRQSILKKAFEGKLLSEQELENIKNHPEYESAETLLENIKKERTK
ncbi:MAG: restriction endonuclease subunit S [Arcobacteraceae bacterium]